MLSIIFTARTVPTSGTRVLAGEFAGVDDVVLPSKLIPMLNIATSRIMLELELDRFEAMVVNY